MKEIISNSTFFGVFISLLAYEAGVQLKKKWKLAIFNPLLVSIVLVMVFLLVFHIDYDSYNQGAQYLSYLLTPATVCLAIPLYQQLSALKSNWRAILSGILAGVLSSVGSVLVLCFLFGMSHQQYVTLLPKSITTAIGMGVSEELGGIVNITVAVIIVTGILGNALGEQVLKLVHITEPEAKGIAMGSSAHVMGTSRAMEMGPVEGAMSSLSVVVSGLITIVVASLFANLL
jgi:predicted murein hydrolase (TIGR00659 family)